MAHRWRRSVSQRGILLQTLHTAPGWQTLHELSVATGIPEASLSAQLRNLRKAEYGGHRIDKCRLNGGWAYRIADPIWMTLNEDKF